MRALLALACLCTLAGCAMDADAPTPPAGAPTMPFKVDPPPEMPPSPPEPWFA